MIHIRIDEQHLSAKALLDYLKTLDFVSIEETQEPNEWQMQKLDELQVSQDNGELEFVSWNQAKEKLSKKYRV
jgi:hypothetical protein